MVAGTASLAGLPLEGPLLLLAFCATLLVYHLDRTPALSPEDAVNHPLRWQWRRRYAGTAAMLAVAAAAGACWALPHLQARTLWAGTVLALPAAAYALPIFRGGQRLKDIGPVKPFAVAAAWAGASVVLPAFEADSSLTGAAPELALLAGYRFLFILPNVLLADAADRDGDARAELHTTATAWSPCFLRRLVEATLGAGLVGGTVALAYLEVPTLLAVDLLGLVAAAGVVAAGGPGRRIARAADCVMLWPAITAAVAWL